MYPVLLKIGRFPIYTYGSLIAIAFLVGLFIARYEARRLGEDPDKIMDICFYGLIAAIVGSRLFYVAINPKIFLSDPMEIFKIWNGGLVFYGGFICALFVLIFYVKKQKMPLWLTADILTPSLAIAHSIGRIGCFFAGCCYGKVCDLPWAVTFSRPESLAPIGIPLHPTQLYSAANNLFIFCILWLFRHHKKFDGQLFWMYVLLYGIGRSIIEIFRGDFREQSIFGFLSVSQAIGGAMSIIAVVMLVRLSKSSIINRQ